MLTLPQTETIRRLTQQFNPIFVGVFGSYARGEQTSKSDLDLLIDFEQPLNLLELIGLEQELSEVLGVKVDLVTQRSVNARLKPYIEADLIRIL